MSEPINNESRPALFDLSFYKELDKQQKHTAIATFLAWGVDAFDNLIFGFVMYALMKEFQTTQAMLGFVATCTMFASAAGGMLFGYLSDRFGRKSALVWSILLFSVFTFVVGFSTDMWFLLITRVLVGIGLGGEWSAGSALIAESWPEKHRGKGVAFMQCGMSVGGILGAMFAGPVIAAWGWRYLFWVATIPGIFTALYIMIYVKESQIWLESKEKMKTAPKVKKQSATSLIRAGYLGTTMLGLIFVSFIMLAQWPVANFATAYFNTPVAQGGIGLGTAASTQLSVPTYIGALLGYLSFGFISDRIGRKKCFFIFLAGAGVLFPLKFIIVGYSVIAYMVTAVVAGYFTVGLYSGLGVMLAEAFPTELRGIGIGFCYNGGRAIGSIGIFAAGALIPLVGYLPVLVGFSFCFVWLAFITTFFLQDKTGVKFEA